jgi:hypothetical protein
MSQKWLCELSCILMLLQVLKGLSKKGTFYMVDPNTIPQTVATTKGSALPCCPDLTTDPVCDVIDFHNRLTFPSSARTDLGIPISVEVILHTHFTRCSGPFALGDLVYSTTLLPGEKVRLATTDRRSRFSVDSESNLSYRTDRCRKSSIA